MSERGAVVIGATAGVGRAVADRLAAQGYSLVVTGRSHEDVVAVAADLGLRHGVAVHAMVLDLCGEPPVGAFVDEVAEALTSIDAVLVPAGVSMPDDSDDGVSDPDLTRRIIDTNFTGVAAVTGCLIEVLERQGRGVVVLFSSIAASAPRRRNVAYAAAKAGLNSYAASLRHRFDGTDLSVQLYVLGYVDTNLSRGQALRLPPAKPGDIAERIVSDLHRGSVVVHAPGYWRLVTAVLRRLPWVLYRRLQF